MSYQLQISIHNYDGNNYVEAVNSYLDEFKRYENLINAINNSTTIWNWFDKLPSNWDGEKYVYNLYRITQECENKFNTQIPAKDIIDFFNKFTPNGADRIDHITMMSVSEFIF